MKTKKQMAKEICKLAGLKTKFDEAVERMCKAVDAAYMYKIWADLTDCGYVNGAQCFVAITTGIYVSNH